MLSLLRGNAAEDRALRHLQAQGLRLLTRNWRCKGGELDLVMLDGAVLAIVEVRARGRGDYGDARESIGARKQSRIVHAARSFLAAHPLHAHREVRFDVVAIDGTMLEWLPAAFEAGVD